VSTFSHLLLDWTNSYGVHPFWPANNRWRYGDTVFIIEPWLWVVSIPTLVAASTRRIARTVLSIILLAGLALAWRVDFVSSGAATALTLGALLFVALARFLGSEARVAVAIAGWVVVTLLMAAAMHTAREIALGAAREADPTAAMLDVVVSPLPANPICAEVITVEQAGVMYRAATARVSIAPAVAPAERCGTRQVTGSLIASSRRRSTPAVHWDGEWSAPTVELATLARESCVALAAMRFIRVPIWSAVGDSTVLIGDIRYGGGAGNGFTDVRVPRLTSSCPRWIPPWTPPRADLLRLAAP
jgi:inner membrane protein